MRLATLILLFAWVPPPVLGQACVSKPELATVGGRIIDATTNLPLFAAKATLVWRAEGDRRATTKEVETDLGGHFTVCDVAPNTRVFVSASFWDEDGRADPVEVAAGARADVVVSIDAPGARVVGLIIEQGSRQPIAAASVTLGDGGPTRVSGADGRFVFADIPQGRFPVSIVHVGFQDLGDSLTVEIGTVTNVTVTMAPNVIPLDPIVVEVQSLHLLHAGFYDRQARGLGSYLTRADIEAAIPLVPSDMLRTQAGVQLVRRSYGVGYTVVGRGNCPFRYFVDGTRVGPTFQIDDFPVDWIEAIEIYRGASSVPIEFVIPPHEEFANCGVIVIWTRSRL